MSHPYRPSSRGRRALAACLVSALVVPTAAVADLPVVPRHAKKLTKQLLYNAAWNAGTRELSDTTEWPKGAVLDVTNCRLSSKRRGGCDYRLRAAVYDPVTGYITKLTLTCERRVTVRLVGRSQRVRTSVRKLDCVTA